MFIVHVQNVAEALPIGVDLLLRNGVWNDSRAGRALVAPSPVVTVYEKPTDRVLLSAVRDANPFFHVAEAMWMLAGRDDSAFLDTFVRDFGARFADEGVIHGAYGHRWRKTFHFDQLDAVVAKLRFNDQDRQCVIQMWDCVPKFDEGSSDLLGGWKDRPCNTHIYLRVRGDRGQTDHGNGNVQDYDNRVLDMTVCCRSNDIILGAYGANAVHFSFLHEYLAARIGVGVGTYYQFSNNYHMYEHEMDRLVKRIPTLGTALTAALTDTRIFPPVRLVDDPATFDTELVGVLEAHERLLLVDNTSVEQKLHEYVDGLSNKFFPTVLWPMLMTHRKWTTHRSAAHFWSCEIKDEGWRTAVQEWMQRRVK